MLSFPIALQLYPSWLSRRHFYWELRLCCSWQVFSSYLPWIDSTAGFLGRKGYSQCYPHCCSAPGAFRYCGVCVGSVQSRGEWNSFWTHKVIKTQEAAIHIPTLTARSFLKVVSTSDSETFSEEQISAPTFLQVEYLCISLWVYGIQDNENPILT